MNVWLNRDVANVIKGHADPITYGRLLRVGKIFRDNESRQRMFAKLSNHRARLLDENPDPKRPPSAYMLFCRDTRPVVQKETGAEFVTLTKEVAKRWSDTTPVERIPYQRQAQARKELWEYAQRFRGTVEFQKRVETWKRQIDSTEKAIKTISWTSDEFHDRLKHPW